MNDNKFKHCTLIVFLVNFLFLLVKFSQLCQNFERDLCFWWLLLFLPTIPRTQTDTSPVTTQLFRIRFRNTLLITETVTLYLLDPAHLVSLNCCLQITEARCVYARHSAQSTPAAAWATAHWTGFLQSFGSLGTPSSLLHHSLPTSWNQPQTYVVVAWPQQLLLHLLHLFLSWLRPILFTVNEWCLLPQFTWRGYFSPFLQ